ncbi:hypothetical protein [Paractinoplanes maris]|uniref:hypothetical protein n=1 Tax=Paractinoplanes maris TaxID=1734446 RepID=UPI00202271E5|nr:hypothetical protein [Actinoplanes maris]
MSAADTTAQDVENRRRLAEAVRARRLELRLSVRAAATQTGVARDTWIGLEEATRRTAETNYAGIERTLQWEPGSVLAILESRDPTTKDAGGERLLLTGSYSQSTPIREVHPADAAIIRIMHNPDITDEQKARIVRAVIAEQQRVGERYADELIAQARSEKP